MQSKMQCGRELNEFERMLLDKLLSASFTGAQELRKQAASIRGFVVDGNGSLALTVSIDQRASVTSRIPVEAAARDYDGTLIHAVLHVRDGRLVELEFYRDAPGEIVRMPRIDEWEVNRFF